MKFGDYQSLKTFKEFIFKFSHEIIIIIFPLFVFLLNEKLVFFDNPHEVIIDPWVYAGYFVNLDKFLPLFGETYYGDRISWILPGYGLYHIFPPIIAHIVLHIVFFITSLLAMYILLKMAFDRNTALFTTLLFGAYPFFLFEISTDYPSGAVITYMVLAFASLNLALKKNYSKLFLFASGIFFACMAYAQIFSLVFLPVFIFTFLFFSWRQKIQTILYEVSIFLAGGIVISVFFTICNYIITGSQFFFVTQITQALYYATTNINPYYIPISFWIWNAVWLIVPALIAVTSLIFLYFNHRSKFCINPYFLLFQINYLLMLAIFIYLNLKQNPSADLQITYYACYLIPLIFLALGAQLSSIISKIEGKKILVLIAIELLLFLPLIHVPLNFIKSIIISFNYVIFCYMIALLILIILILILIVLSLSLIKNLNYQKSWLPLIVIIILSGSLSLLYTNYSNFNYYNTNVDPTLQLGTDTDAYLLIFDTVQEINTFIPENHVGIWYGKEKIDNKTMFGIFNNINAIYLWQYTMIGQDFPNITSENVNKYASNEDSKIVILSTKEDAFSLAQKALNKINYKATLIETKRFQRGEVFLYCTIIAINSIDPIRDQILNGSITTSNNTQQIILPDGSTNLASSLDKNMYGLFGRDSVITTINDSTVFNPTSDRDHLASPFFPIPADNSSETYLVIGIQSSVGSKQVTYSNASIVLQDENYSIISGNLFVPTHNTTPKPVWQIENVIHIPQNTREVRLYITSSDGHSAVLPAKIEMYKVIINDPKLLKPSGSGSAL